MDAETLTETTTDIVTTLEATVENTCWPTHHDYQQANGQDYNGLPVMFCRLCGDTRVIKAEPPATEEPIHA